MTITPSRNLPVRPARWFGIVPSHWTTPRLATMFREVDRPADTMLPILSVSIHSGVTDNELADNDRDRKVNLSDDRTKYQRVQPDDLVYNMMRAWQGAFGTVTVDGLVSPAYVVAQPKEQSFRSRFVELLLQTPSGIEEVRRFSKGIADFRMRLYWDHFRNIVVCLPPIEEQDMILSYLDEEINRIDRLVDKKQNFITLLLEKRVAISVLTVTKGLHEGSSSKQSGINWIGSTPAHWSVCKLNFRYMVELGKMLDSSRVSGIDSINYLRNRDVQWGFINDIDLPVMDISRSEVSRYTVKSGDLLVCEGGDVGRASIWKGKDNQVGYQKALHRVRPRLDAQDNTRFLFYVLFSAKMAGAFAEQDDKSTISHLTAEAFREFKFPFPPADEQAAIVEYLDREWVVIDSLISKTRQSIDLLREHRSALITAAVTGKIDVRGLAANDMKAAA